ncbi:MAG: hypothetical protein JWO09_3496 [Bacteroidetes bacterium]|nr:hypothetical protein [Bacteroidota bacterium]
MKKILLLCGVFSSAMLAAQTAANSASEVLYPVDFHISRPLSELPDFEETENLYEKEETKDREHRPTPNFDFTYEKDGAAYGNDASSIQSKQGDRSPATPIASFAGQSGGGYPPDPSGAAGPNHYVQAVNATPFKVFNKTTGTTLMSPKNIGTLWSPATGNLGDPIVMYDRYADRWFLAQFGQSGSTNYVYIAISTTPDPTGTYYTYTYTSASFPDYLKFSIWGDGYYMTSNQGGRLYVFERTKMLAGISTARSVTATFSVGGTSGFWCPLAADADGGLPPAATPCPFFWFTDNSWSGAVDGVKYCKATVNWTPATPTLSITPATQITTAAFNGTYNSSWDDVPQPSTTAMLDGIGGVATYRAQYRRWTGYNTILLNWGVLISATPRQRAIKWVELRENTATPGVWTLYQEGTYQPDTKTRWVGSMAMDDNGAIALCYARSASTTSATDIGYPSLCYTGRCASDPLGQMTMTETLVKAGTASQTTVNRFGDYSQTALDPDGLTFWHTCEYIGGSGTSGSPRTWIYSFRLPTCATGIAEEASHMNTVTAFQSNNEINVKGENLNVEGELVVDLFDVTGKQITGKQVMTNGTSVETSFNIDNLASGTYLVRVGKVNTSFQRVVKLVVTK